MVSDGESSPSSRDTATVLAAGGPNAVAYALGLLGDEWTLLIVQQSLLGVRRYSHFKKNIPISHAVLTARLALLTHEELLQRHEYQDRPVRAEYLPTARMRSLWPIMLSIWEWERRWVPEHSATLPAMHHTVCGSEFQPVLTCKSCDQPTDSSDVTAAWGPSGSWQRSVPEASTRRRPDSDDTHGQAGLFPETMTILGNRWSSAVIGAAFRGITRFTDFERNLGAPPTVIAERLRVLVSNGVLHRVDDHSRAERNQYRLTPKGLAFFATIATTMHWAQHWFRAPEGLALIQTHRACGGMFEPSLLCDHCRHALAGADIAIVE